MKSKITLLFLFTLLFMGCVSGIKEEKASPNVLIYPHEGPPLTAVKLVLKGGNAFDRKGGEIYLLSRILSQSSFTRTLENWGATLGIEAEYDYLALEYEILSNYTKDSVSGMISFLKNYRISQGEFELAKNQLLQELKIQKDDFYHRARYEFYKTLYGKHRYGKPLSGTLETVRGISLEDIRKVYGEVLQYPLSSLILVGEVRREDRDFYENSLSQLPSDEAPLWENTELTSSMIEKKIVDKEVPSTQVFVRIGTMGISRKHPDYLKYSLIADMIGGGFGSIVMRKLREEQGLTYSPVANFYSQRKEKGYFFIAYSTRAENLEKSLRLIEKIFKQLKEKGVSVQNFLLNRRYNYGKLLQREETNSRIAGLLTEQVVFSLEPGFWKDYRKKLEEMEYHEVNKLVRKFFENKEFIYIILKPGNQNGQNTP
jgi:zinc protease